MNQAAIFAVGVALTGISLVFDQATIGLMRGGLQLTRNAVFAVAKLLILAAVAITLHDQFGVGISVSWVAGIALSMVLLMVPGSGWLVSPFYLGPTGAFCVVLAGPHWPTTG